MTSKRITVDGRTFTLRINEWGTVTVKGLPGWWSDIASARKSLAFPKQSTFTSRY